MPTDDMFSRAIHTLSQQRQNPYDVIETYGVYLGQDPMDQFFKWFQPWKRWKKSALWRSILAALKLSYLGDCRFQAFRNSGIHSL